MSLRRRSIIYSGSPPPVLTFTANPTFVTTSSGGGVHTHSGLNFGTASAKRALIASVNSGIQPASLTIGGVAATRVVSGVASGTGAGFCELWIALVPTGTSGSVVLPNQSSGYVSAVAIYAVTNLRSLTPFATDTDTGNPSVSMSLSVPGGGFAIASIWGNGSPTSVSWTGVTENFDSLSPAATTITSGGSFSPASTTTRSIAATIANSSLFTAAACAASFR